MTDTDMKIALGAIEVVARERTGDRWPVAVATYTIHGGWRAACASEPVLSAITGRGDTFAAACADWHRQARAKAPTQAELDATLGMGAAA